MAWSEARKGQTAVEMSCGCDGPGILVRSDCAPRWRCSRCHKGWPSGRKITLGKGSLPEPDSQLQLTGEQLRSLTSRRAS